MSQLNGIFDWTGTYLQESEVTEVHGVTERLFHNQNQSKRTDENRIQPDSYILSIMKKKKK